VCLTSVEGLGRFAQATGETVVHERKLEDALEGIENGHLSLGCGISGDLDLVGLCDLSDGGGGFFVRLEELIVSTQSCFLEGKSELRWAQREGGALLELIRLHTILNDYLRVLKKRCFSLLIFSLLLCKEKGNKRDDISRDELSVNFSGLCEGSPKMEMLR
jgi:hypothetical protein